MSHVAENFVWRNRKVRSSLKFILLCIAKHHDARTGRCSPSIKDLCADSRMSVTSVRRNIDLLVEKDFLKIYREEGFGKRYLYVINNFDPKESTRKKKIKSENARPVDLDNPGELWLTMFDGIWNIYPRKVNKSAAQKAFSKIDPNQDIYIAIMNNVRDRMLNEWSESAPKYIPHLATYLNNERWKDALEPNPDGPKIKMEGDNEYLKGL